MRAFYYDFFVFSCFYGGVESRETDCRCRWGLGIYSFDLLGNGDYMFSGGGGCMKGVWGECTVRGGVVGRVVVTLLLTVVPFTTDTRRAPIMRRRTSDLLSPDVVIGQRFCIGSLPLSMSGMGSVSTVGCKRGNGLVVFAVCPGFAVPGR